MNHCSDLYFLSTIACKLPECLTEEELELLAANLKALGEMIDVVIAQKAICRE